VVRVLWIIGTALVAFITWHFQQPVIDWLSGGKTSELADRLGIIGFPITLFGLGTSAWAAYGVAQLRKKYVAKARLPELAKKIQTDASAFVDLAGQIPVPMKAKAAAVSAIKSDLAALKVHLRAEYRAQWKSAAKAVKKFEQGLRGLNNQRGAVSEIPAFWTVYEELGVLAEAVENYLSDQSWEG
jgi:hypothetical protein